ncbi:tRNA-splicing endonuclease subunit sen54 [Mortierella claussenii]|nr:tRNA-splicing endonuclease subunit sen54 [Mortierella claussenii]
MGHMLHGSAYLYPEEALYLVDRGSLLVDYYGSDLSVQQMWSLYLSQKGNDSLRMERYLTYAYLKRLGFVVIRPGIYDHQKTQQTSAFLSQVLKRSWSGLTLWCSTLWKTLFTTWRLRVRAMVSGIGLRLVSIVGMWTAPSSRPLIANNVQSCYDRILQDLQIIPTMRLAQSPVQPDFELTVTGSEESGTGASGEREPTIDFEVYKPAGTFKKRQPGIPDYRVVVIGSGASLPSLGELKVMMNGQMDPAQKTPLPGPVVVPGAPNKDKKKKVPDWPKVLFAVVNGGQLSFISMYNIKATP